MVVVAMEMDDVPRFELARDNMPAPKVAQERNLSKGIWYSCPPTTKRAEKLRRRSVELLPN
jgi:hypothetical protein